MPPTRRPRRVLPAIPIALASVLSFLALIAIWTKQQLLDTPAWTTTSVELLEDPDLRAALGDQLAVLLLEPAALEQRIGAALPDEAAALARPAGRQARELAGAATAEALADPAVKRLWAEANARAHTALVDLLEGGDQSASVDGGVVVLDLGFLAERASSAALGAPLALPDGVGRIEIFRSERLRLAQQTVVALRLFADLLVGAAILLFGLAIAIARERRWQAVAGCGVALLLAGLCAILARQLAEDPAITALDPSADLPPSAASAIWEIATAPLAQMAIVVIAVGLGLTATTIPFIRRSRPR